MKSNKTMDLIQALTIKEYNELKKNLLNNSNLNPQHKLLIEKINPSKLLTIEEIGAKTKLPTKRIQYLLSEIQKEIESWICHNQFVGHSNLKKLTLIFRYYSSRNLDKLAENIYTKIETINTKDFSSIEFFDLFYFYRTLDSSLKNKIKREKFPTTIQYLKFIDIYHAIETIKLVCEERNRVLILKTETSSAIFHDNRLESIKMLRTESNLIDKYLTIYDFLSDKIEINEETILELIDSFNQLEITNENIVDIHTISHYIINIILLSIQNGNTKFRIIMFDFIESLIKKNIFIENNQIPYSLFSLVFNNAIKIDKPDWAKSFLENFNQYIPQVRRENDLKFLNLNILIYENRFEEAEAIISKLEYDHYDTFQKLGIYRMIIKIQISLKPKNNDYLNSAIKNMKSMLQYNEIGLVNKELHVNFILNCLHIIKGNTEIKCFKTMDLEWFQKKIGSR